MSTTRLVICYLAALVLANLLVFHAGQVALLFTGLVLVPFDFAVRVRLQEAWAGVGLWGRLAGLMVVGGILTVVTVPGSHRIALASVSAFLVGSAAGAIVYAALEAYGRTLARFSSLAVMAIADSLVFPNLAFDAVSQGLIVGQAVMKWAISSAIVYFKLLEEEGPRETKSATTGHCRNARQ